MDLAQTAIGLRWEFRRHHLTERERLLADWILDFSIVCGREEMGASTLDTLGDLCRMSRGNVHTTIESLRDMGVLTTRHGETGVVYYRINPDSSSWKARERLKLPALKCAMAELRGANGLDTDFFTRSQRGSGPAPEVPPLESFFVSRMVSESGTVPGSESRNSVQ